MHPTALAWGEQFFNVYAAGPSGTVLDIGSQDINGSLKSVCPPSWKYIGVDFAKGKGVDVVLDDPYRLPFEKDFADIVVSSSCFEHSEMFWVLFLEILRVLKPSGVFYLNVPSNGMFHRFPVDCWRFYPDSGRALVTWAKRSSYDPLLLASFVGDQGGGGKEEGTWNDFVAVFVKDRSLASRFPRRIVDAAQNFTNGVRDGGDGFLKPVDYPEDQAKIQVIGQLANGLLRLK
jgi:SAM-dependent methyltransferase